MFISYAATADVVCFFFKIVHVCVIGFPCTFVDCSVENSNLFSCNSHYLIMTKKKKNEAAKFIKENISLRLHEPGFSSHYFFFQAQIHIIIMLYNECVFWFKYMKTFCHAFFVYLCKFVSIPTSQKKFTT